MEWLRILKVGGKLDISVPNLAFAAREIVKADEDPNHNPGVYPIYQIYGRQLDDPGELHRNGFTKNALQSLLEIPDLGDVEVKIEGEFGENLRATAIKVKSARPIAIMPIWRAIALKEPGESVSEEPVAPLAKGVLVHEGAMADSPTSTTGDPVVEIRGNGK